MCQFGWSVGYPTDLEDCLLVRMPGFGANLKLGNNVRYCSDSVFESKVAS